MVNPEKSAKKSGPIYKHIENDLRARIGQGNLMPGVMLPSRRRLAAEYGVALATAERAITSLLQDGTLRADGGRGTFVVSSAGRRASVSAQIGALGIVSTLAPLGPWDALVVQNVEKAFSQDGGVTRFFDRGARSAEAVSLSIAVQALAGQCTALVVINLHAQPDAVETVSAALSGVSLPVVHITAAEIQQPILNVYYDGFDAGYQAAQHLWEQGCREVAFVAPFSKSWVEARVTGAQAAWQQCGGGQDRLRVVYVQQEPWPDINPTNDPDFGPNQYRDAGQKALRQMLEKEKPDGIVAANDFTAEGVLSAASAQGWHAGQDFALVGFDDNPHSRVLGLSSLRPPLEELGREAGWLAAQALRGDLTRRRTCLNSNLIARASSHVQNAPGALVAATRQTAPVALVAATRQTAQERKTP